MLTDAPARLSPWPHRLAVVLALVTFPLIWVGGLVTTYDAGMAVPDWPGTYGYNLLRYPWQSWLAAPWDLFIEHGHRLLGAAAGLIAIALVLAAWRAQARCGVLGLAGGALALVIVQGALGGARVLFDERLLAMVHGCVGPLFFAYLAIVVVATSPDWDSAAAAVSRSHDPTVRTAWTLVAMAYLQLVLGAVLRHIPLAATPGVFRAVLVMHLLLAAGLLLYTLGFVVSVVRSSAANPRVRRSAWLLCLLVATQLVLGGSTYVVKYAFPAWLQGFQVAAAFVVQEKSLTQSLVTTAHVAMGSLILFVATRQAMIATGSWRLAAGRGASGAVSQLIAGWLVTTASLGRAVA